MLGATPQPQIGWMTGWPGPWWLWLAISILAVIFFAGTTTAIIEDDGAGLGWAGIAAFAAMMLFVVTELALAALICLCATALWTATWSVSEG